MKLRKRHYDREPRSHVTILTPEKLQAALEFWEQWGAEIDKLAAEKKTPRMASLQVGSRMPGAATVVEDGE